MIKGFYKSFTERFDMAQQGTDEMLGGVDKIWEEKNKTTRWVKSNWRNTSTYISLIISIRRRLIWLSNNKWKFVRNYSFIIKVRKERRKVNKLFFSKDSSFMFGMFEKVNFGKHFHLTIWTDNFYEEFKYSKISWRKNNCSSLLNDRNVILETIGKKN